MTKRMEQTQNAKMVQLALFGEYVFLLYFHFPHSFPLLSVL